MFNASNFIQVSKIKGRAFIANIASVTEEIPRTLWFHQLCMSGGIQYGFAIVFPIVKPKKTWGVLFKHARISKFNQKSKWFTILQLLNNNQLLLFHQSRISGSTHTQSEKLQPLNGWTRIPGRSCHRPQHRQGVFKDGHNAFQKFHHRTSILVGG